MKLAKSAVPFMAHNYKLFEKDSTISPQRLKHYTRGAGTRMPKILVSESENNDSEQPRQSELLLFHSFDGLDLILK